LRKAALQRPHWLQWDAPNSPPNLPLTIRRSQPPSNIPIRSRRIADSSTDPTHHPKRHPDPISHFPQYTLRTGRPKGRPSDSWSRRMFRNISRIRSLDTSDVAKKLKAIEAWRNNLGFSKLRQLAQSINYAYSVWRSVNSIHHINEVAVGPITIQRRLTVSVHLTSQCSQPPGQTPPPILSGRK